LKNSGRDKLPVGKLSIDILGPILDSMPTAGLPVSSRIGMDAGIVKINGNKIFSSSQVIVGREAGTAEQLVSDLVKKIANLGKPIVIDPVVLIPVGTSSDIIRRVLLEICESAESRGMIVGKGHTEITTLVKEITLIATVFASV